MNKKEIFELYEKLKNKETAVNTIDEKTLLLINNLIREEIKIKSTKIAEIKEEITNYKTDIKEIKENIKCINKKLTSKK